MSDKGKSLEQLVAQIEELRLPDGFSLETNRRIFNDGGAQIAEFDIEIRGPKEASGESWLIECRNRPSSGAAPGSWIEQLAGRKQRFHFTRVTAVSTTGFAQGATEAAKDLGIELHSVEDLEPEAISAWCGLRTMKKHAHTAELKSARLLISSQVPKAQSEALGDLLQESGDNPEILRSVSTGEVATLASAFLAAVNSVGNMFDDVVPNGPSKTVRLLAKYPADDDHFVVDTNEGTVRIEKIAFVGSLSVLVTSIPIGELRAYLDEADDPISQSIEFPVEVAGRKCSIEFHNLTETGVTHVLLRAGANDG